MPRPDVVLDTNVLISSLWRGNPWEVVKRWRDGQFQLVISPSILSEYLDVLGRFVSPDVLQQWVETLTDPTRVRLVEPSDVVSVIREDPTDNRFLECAIAAEADAIVSGDHHLLALKEFRGIPIFTPAAFLQSFVS